MESGVGGPRAPETAGCVLDKQLQAALQELCDGNDDVVRGLRRASAKVAGLAEQQHKAKRAAGDLSQQVFAPEVLVVLKRNADQLLELKKQHIADRQATQETGQRLMQWSLGTAASGDAALQADVVKHGRFRHFQVPGSSSSSSTAAHTAASSGWKFWQVGVQGAPWRPADSDMAASSDQAGGGLLASQTSLTSLLFGKGRRSLGGSSGPPASPSRRLSVDPAASWRSSFDSGGSRRHSGPSGRSSDSGGGALRASMSLAQVPAVVAPAVGSEGGIWASLAAGEGPLSKSHSLLAKPGPQAQEQVVGGSLECVAEDPREGRDSPVPGSGPASRPPALTMMQSAPAAIRTHPSAENFSFGNKPAEEPHSPCFLRGSSASSRFTDMRCSMAAAEACGPAGPLLRSSLALSRHTIAKVDPFDAVEPEPQLQFVEQMKQEDKVLRAARASLSGAGVMGSLRRSISGAVKASSSAAAGPKWDVDAAAGPLASAAAHLPHQQQQQQLGVAPVSGAGSAAMQPPQERPGTATEAAQLSAEGSEQATAEAADPDSSAAASEQSQQAAASACGDGATAAEPVAARSLQQLAHSEITPVDEEEQQQDNSQPQQLQEQRVNMEDSRVSVSAAGISPQPSGLLASATSATHLGQRAQGTASRPSSAAPHQQQHQQAGSRRPSSAGGIASPVVCSSPCRALPVMGQASMDILSRQSVSQLGQQGSKPLASSSLRLTDVYQATSGSASPLAAGLASLRRSSSQGGRTIGPGLAGGGGNRAAPRSLLAEAPLHGSFQAPPPVGPLQQQYSGTMLQAKRSVAGPGLLSGSPREADKKRPGWDWQQLGLPTGPGSTAGDASPAGAAAGQPGNKYAASWGLADAGSSAGGGRHSGPGMARQSGTGSQQQQQQQLSRQNSAGSMRGTPRHADSQHQARQQWQQQQQQQQYSAVRYGHGAMPASESQSPRSDRGLVPAASGTVLGWQPPQQQQQQQQYHHHLAAAAAAATGHDDGSEDFHSATDSMSNTSASSSRHGTTAGGGWASGRGQAPPTPPAFLATSAQAAVAAQWNPNVTPPYVAVPVSPEASGMLGAASGQQGVSPRAGMASPYASPRPSDSGAAGLRQAVYGHGPQPGGGLSRQSSSSRLYQQHSSGGLAYAGGYSLGPPGVALSRQPSGGSGRQFGAGMQPAYAGQQQQQQVSAFASMQVQQQYTAQLMEAAGSGGPRKQWQQQQPAGQWGSGGPTGYY